MAKDKYVEPKSYFNDSMKKAEKEWEKKEAEKKKQSAPTKKK